MARSHSSQQQAHKHKLSGQEFAFSCAVLLRPVSIRYAPQEKKRATSVFWGPLLASHMSFVKPSSPLNVAESGCQPLSDGGRRGAPFVAGHQFGSDSRNRPSMARANPHEPSSVKQMLKIGFLIIV